MADKKIIAKHYDTLLRPVITEKTSMVSAQNKVVFEIPMSATKEDAKAAVEAIYGVSVKKVNTVIRDGKERKFKGVKGRTNSAKRAYITLAEGAKIDLAGGEGAK